MKKDNLKSRYALICVVFVISIIMIAFSVSYAFLKPRVTGENTETNINTATFDIETSLTDLSGLNASNLLLIEESEVQTRAEKLDFTVKSTATTSDAGKFNVYLKDVAISNGLIDSNFKWDLIMDGNIIKSGNFSNIETIGKSSTTRENTTEIKYFDTYYLTSGIDFNDFEQSNLTFRIYLLNDSTEIQNNLMNGSFECKVGVEAYSVNE